MYSIKNILIKYNVYLTTSTFTKKKCSLFRHDADYNLRKVKTKQYEYEFMWVMILTDLPS